MVLSANSVRLIHSYFVQCCHSFSKFVISKCIKDSISRMTIYIFLGVYVTERCKLVWGLSASIFLFTGDSNYQNYEKNYQNFTNPEIHKLLQISISPQFTILIFILRTQISQTISNMHISTVQNFCIYCAHPEIHKPLQIFISAQFTIHTLFMT